MKAIKISIQYILTIILVLAILAYFFIILFSTTVLKKQYIMNKIESTNYYSKIYENVKLNFEKYIEQSGFDETILKDVVSEEKVKDDTQIIINNIYEGTNKKIETQEIKSKITQNISQFLNGQKMNKIQQNAINTFVEHLCNEYTETISDFNIGKQINPIYQKVIEYMNMAKKIIIICIILDILILFMINLKKIYKCVSLIGISLGAVGFWLIVTNLFINSQINVKNIIILNNAISDVIVNILTELLNIINKGGIYLLIFGVILIFSANLIHNIKETKTEENY